MKINEESDLQATAGCHSERKPPAVVGDRGITDAWFNRTHAAHANPTCTTERKEKWMSEETIKAKIAALRYHKIRSFKVTESCYEIYGSDKNNKLVEVYFNPITGDIVPP
jgi:hypothetical protein